MNSQEALPGSGPEPADDQRAAVQLDAAPPPRPVRARAAPPVVETDAQRLTRPANEPFSLTQRTGQLINWISNRLVAHPMMQRGGYPLKLLVVPPALWRGDAERGAAIAKGRLTNHGFELNTQTMGFAQARGSPAALAWLHGFGWLADLAAAHDTISAAPIAERLVKLWLADSKRLPALAWTPDVTAQRLMAWMCHAPLLLSSNDQVYRSAVLTALARFARHLHGLADKAPDGVMRMTAASGLALAGLALPGRDSSEARAAALMTAVLDRHVLPDGGFSSRCPAHLLAVVRLALTVKATYQARGIAPPDGIMRAIDRAVPALKGLMLGDGGLASFNGSGPGDPAHLDEVLSLAQVGAKPLRNGAHSGFQRLEGGRAVLILDVGPPPSGAASYTAHAGTLGFEFSDGPQRLIVNCGGDAARPSATPPPLQAAVRHTPAHSTLTLAGQDSTVLAADGRLAKGVTEAIATRQENGEGTWIDGSHDGYVARSGLRHRRRLFLKANGMDLRGEDRLEPVRASKTGRDHRVDIRFHLAPGVTAVPTQGGAGVALKLPGGAAWMFRARGAVLAVDESISLTPTGPRKTSQIVLSAAAPPQGAVVTWSFRRQAK